MDTLHPGVGENFHILEMTIYRKLKKHLKKELTDYTDQKLRDACYIAVHHFHEDEVTALQEAVKRGARLCSTCGRCCTEYDILLTEADLERMGGAGVDITQHTISDPNNPGRYNFIHKPCRFLQSITHKCMIYRDRPGSCRNYPLISPGGVERMSRDPDCMYVVRFFLEKTLHILTNETTGG